ncbi:MAG: hypothetical protein R3E96_05415 [Planctomycetota bacterium]
MRWRASQRGIEIFALEVTLSGNLRDPFVFFGTAPEGDAALAAIDGRLFIDADTDEETLAELWREVQARSPILASSATPSP